MRPLALRLRNFRSFEQDTTITFVPGCTAVVGSNGAGKSSLISAVELALFGPEGRSLEPYATTGGDGEMTVEVELEHAGATYRVRRAWSSRGRGKSLLDFEWFAPDNDFQYGWEPLTAASAADTQAAVETTLGLTRETFRASAYLAQGDGGSFSEAQPKDRKRLLADALGLHLWTTGHEHVAADLRTRRNQLAELDGRVTLLGEQAGDVLEAEIQAKTLQLELGVCEEELADAHAGVISAETMLKTEEKALEQWDARRAAADTAEKLASAQRQLGVQAQVARERLDGERQDVSRLERLAGEHAQVVEGLAALEQAERDRADAVATRDHLLAEYGRLVAEAERVEQRINDNDALRVDAEQKITALNERDRATCDRCGQHLAGDAWQAAFESLAADLDTARIAVSRAKNEHSGLRVRIMDAEQAAAEVVIPTQPDGATDLRARLLELHAAPSQLAAAVARVAELERTAALLDDPAYRGELDRLEREAAQVRRVLEDLGEPEPGAIRRCTEQVAEARAERARISGERDRLRDMKASAEAAWVQAQRNEIQLQEARNQHADVAADVIELELLERAFGRDGVPAWYVEQQAVPTIEAEANRILHELGGPVARLELHTQRELKSGGTRDALDIVCVTDAGARDYASFSGGERCRVDVALRLALARLLATRRGAEIRWLALDEPEALDEAGMQALAGVLRGLVQDGVVDSVLLASHVPTLRDAFDASILVERNGGGSVVTLA